MAKQTVVPYAQMSAADLYWKPEFNHRKDQVTGTQDLVSDMANGWNPVHGLIAVESISDLSTIKGVDLVTECVNKRTQLWNFLKTDNKPDALIKRKVFEDMYVKDGAVRKPKYAANMGFRRGSIWFDAQVARVKDGLDVADSVPVVVRKYNSDVERITDQVEENEKKAGRPTSQLDKLSAAWDLFVLGCNENTLRNLFKTSEGKAGSTVGQKCFKICRLHKAFPGLTILSRLFLKPDEEGFIPYGPITVSDLLAFMHRLDQTADKKTGIVPAVLTEADLVEYFSNVRGNSTPPTPVMKPKAIESVKNQTDTEVIKDIMSSVLEGNSTKLEKHAPMAVGYNSITKIGPTGLYPTVESVLVAALTAAQSSPNDPVNCIRAIQAECDRLLQTIATTNAQPIA